MTINGWVAFIAGSMLIAIVANSITKVFAGGELIGTVAGVCISAFLIFGLFCGMRWYFTSTASGQRAMVDQRSDINNGIERTVTVYTADGQVIASYTGKIDLEGNDGGYVLFDYNGKRYTYYNCFVESIAELGD